MSRRAAAAAQLEAAERAAARPDELEDAPTAWLDAIRQIAADATRVERQRVVRAMLAPGAVLDGTSVRLTLRVAVGASRAEPGAGDARAVVPGCRTHHENTLKIRLVA